MRSDFPVAGSIQTEVGQHLVGYCRDDLGIKNKIAGRTGQGRGRKERMWGEVHERDGFIECILHMCLAFYL